jgi:hypothetical protein
VIRVFTLLSVLLLTCASAAVAESKSPADYPLRLALLGQQEIQRFHNGVAEEAKGDGRANLFENGVAHAVNFSYDCSEKVRTSFGYETYPAKWKKQGQELVVLMPVFGKAGSYFTCNFKTDVKTFAYARARNGGLGETPAEQYKVWMNKHEYDPEHGKNTPLRLQSDEPSAAGQSAATGEASGQR